MNALLPADGRGSMAMDYMAKHFDGGGSSCWWMETSSPLTLHEIDCCET